MQYNIFQTFAIHASRCVRFKKKIYIFLFAFTVSNFILNFRENNHIFASIHQVIPAIFHLWTILFSLGI